MADPPLLRRRLLAREHLIGTFVKTPTTHATEILGALGFDFVVIDEEHAPFDRMATDTALLAARAAGTAALVRVQNATSILSVLDCGATGVLVPHVASAARAREVAATCRYQGGRRGYSGSPRHAGYGATGMWKTVEAADAATTVIAQIEDPEALDEIDAIATVDGIDALFIGRGDLAVALGENPPMPPRCAARLNGSARPHAPPASPSACSSVARPRHRGCATRERPPSWLPPTRASCARRRPRLWPRSARSAHPPTLLKLRVLMPDARHR